MKIDSTNFTNGCLYKELGQSIIDGTATLELGVNNTGRYPDKFHMTISDSSAVFNVWGDSYRELTQQFHALEEELKA